MTEGDSLFSAAGEPRERDQRGEIDFAGDGKLRASVERHDEVGAGCEGESAVLVTPTIKRARRARRQQVEQLRHLGAATGLGNHHDQRIGCEQSGLRVHEFGGMDQQGGVIGRDETKLPRMLGVERRTPARKDNPVTSERGSRQWRRRGAGRGDRGGRLLRG